MSGYEWMVFWIAWVLAVSSPGPATLSIVSCAVQHGRRSAVSQALGILTGGAIWGVAAALGVGSLMVANAWLFEILRYLGGIYLLFLAATSLKKALGSPEVSFIVENEVSTRQCYLRGLLINLTNPKAILQWGALYALVVPAHATLLYIFSVFAFLFTGGVVVYVGYAFVFSKSKLTYIYRAFGKYLDMFFSLFFGLAGLKLIFTKISVEST